MTDDPLGRDRHTIRPDHPDFWRLSEIVLEHDATATDAGSLEDVVKEIADLRSVSYMATQRALIFKHLTGSPASVYDLAPMWMDAFAAGVKFEQRRLPQQRKPSE